MRNAAACSIVFLAAFLLHGGEPEYPASSSAAALAAHGIDEAARLEQRQKRLWKWSLVALAAANVADAVTSIHGVETNPILRSGNGRFGYRGVLLKSGFVSAQVALQIHFGRRLRVYKTLSVLNVMQAGLFGGTAVHNTRVRY